MDLLTATREGCGGAIVVQGEPGDGKTALLEYAVASASDFTVLRTVGNEAEMEITYASLQEFFRPADWEVEQLPQPQRRAVEIAFGRTDGAIPDRLLVGLGLLNLLPVLSARRPIVCVVNDAQWLVPCRATFAPAGLTSRRRLNSSGSGVPGVCRSHDCARLLPLSGQ